jgi:hypothetical protein
MTCDRFAEILMKIKRLLALVASLLISLLLAWRVFAVAVVGVAPGSAPATDTRSAPFEAVA